MKRIVFVSLLMVAGSLHGMAQAKKSPPLKESINRGKTVYEQYCLTCHQADGSGVPGMNPPLQKTTFVLGDKKKLIRIVLNGFNKEVEINGETYSNPMPAFDFLKDEEVADVLTYVRNNFTNKASLVTAAEVKTTRGK